MYFALMVEIIIIFTTSVDVDSYVSGLLKRFKLSKLFSLISLNKISFGMILILTYLKKFQAPIHVTVSELTKLADFHTTRVEEA